MKLAVVLPDEAALKSARVRRRFRPLQPAMSALGHGLDLAPVESFRQGRALKADAYLIHGVTDARGLALAHVLRRRGRPVGLDLGRTSLPVEELDVWRAACDLVLEDSGTADTVLVDPAPESVIDQEALAAKQKSARDTKAFVITLWSEALDGQIPLLRPLVRQGYAPRLNVILPPGAMDLATLTRLARLPVPVDLVPSDEAAQDAALAESLVAGVADPTTAVRALAAGAQILAPGLVAADLEVLRYPNFDPILADMTQDRLKLRSDTTAAIFADMQAFAGAEALAARLVAAFDTVTPKAQGTGPICVLHGAGSSGAIHKQAQRLGALSVGTPLIGDKLNFDVAFRPEAAGGLRVDLSDRATEALRPGLRAQKGPKGDGATGKAHLTLPHAQSWLTATPQPAPALRVIDLVRRAPVLAEARAVLHQLFEAPEILIADPVERA